MRKTAPFLALLSLLLTPAALLAHQGHGTFTGHELVHYLTSPAHVLPIAAALLLAVMFYFIRRARRNAAGD